MTNWINSGFQGGPAFVTDLKGFLLDIADAETAYFIEGTALEALCSPWRLDIKIALAMRQATPFEREVRCTLSDIVANMDDFINGDFSQGGWAGWFELTTKPQNNPYGLYLIAASELDQRIAGAQQRETKLLDWGNGFLSYKKCHTIRAAGPVQPGAPVPVEEDCEIVTPGTVIEEQLNNVLYSGQRRIEVADEFNEMVSALLNQLLQRLFGGLLGGGLRGLPSYTRTFEAASASNNNTLQRLKNDTLIGINREIENEVNYKNIKQNTLNTVLNSRSLLLGLQGCYANKLTDLNLDLTSSEISTAQTRINNASTTIATQLEPVRILLENDIAISNLNLNDLNILSNNASNVANITVLNAVNGELVDLQQSGLLNGDNVFTAQEEQNLIVSQMNSLNSTTNAQIAECQNFPPPPNSQNNN